MAEWIKYEQFHILSVPRSLIAESSMFTRRQVDEHFNHLLYVTIYIGGMAEWLKATVLKTVKGESSSRVRIPLPPRVQESAPFGAFFVRGGRVKCGALYVGIRRPCERFCERSDTIISTRCTGRVTTEIPSLSA